MDSRISQTKFVLPPERQGALNQVKQVASELTPEEVFEKGEFLGAGLMGGAYRVKHGDGTYVAKQLGHEQSFTGMLGTHTRKQLELKAQKQAAVQNALVMAGFPAPASAVMGADSTWVLMEESQGTPLEKVPQADRKAADAQLDSLREKARPVIQGVVNELKAQNPGEESLYGDHIEGGATYLQTDQGLLLNGYYDPVV